MKWRKANAQSFAYGIFRLYKGETVIDSSFCKFAASPGNICSAPMYMSRERLPLLQNGNKSWNKYE